MKVDLIVRTNGQLVTCASGGRPKKGSEMGDVGIINGGAVAVSNGKIIAVGKADDLFRAHQTEKTIDAGPLAVCPAFVDPHTHIVFAGSRLDEFEKKIAGADYLEILAAGGGIISTVKATREADAAELAAGGKRRLDKMFSFGTGTVEIKTGYGLDTKTELKMLDAIAELDRIHPIDVVPTFLAAHAIPPEFRNSPDEYVELICEEMLPQAWQWYLRSRFNGRAPFFADVFTEKNAFDRDQSVRILERAASLGFALKAHVDEFTNLGGSRMGIELKASSIDHLDMISGEEIELLAASETVGVITPTVNFNLGSSHFADARRMIDAGCSIALSTDFNPGSAPCPSQQMTMAIACRYQKMSPAEAFNAVTVNAAYSIGRGLFTGSIEPGKDAAFLILHTNDYRDAAYEFGGNMVETVLKNRRRDAAKPSAEHQV